MAPAYIFNSEITGSFTTESVACCARLCSGMLIFNKIIIMQRLVSPTLIPQVALPSFVRFGGRMQGDQIKRDRMQSILTCLRRPYCTTTSCFSIPLASLGSLFGHGLLYEVWASLPPARPFMRHCDIVREIGMRVQRHDQTNLSTAWTGILVNYPTSGSLL